MSINSGPETGQIYEERLVRFLDILGFSSLVKKSADDIEKQLALYEFLKKYSRNSHAKEVFSGFSNGDGSSCDDNDIETLKALYDYRFTQFSDSFVFSVNAEKRASVQYFPLLIGQLLLHALELGFLVRGGISKGALVHEDDGPAFGPAFIDAYQIESRQAVFGRVVLSNEAVDCISRSSTHSAAWIAKGFNGENEITIASCTQEKYSSSLAEKSRAPALNEALRKLKKMRDEIEGPERDRVAEKYNYVISKLQTATEEEK